MYIQYSEVFHVTLSLRPHCTNTQTRFSLPFSSFLSPLQRMPMLHHLTYIALTVCILLLLSIPLIKILHQSYFYVKRTSLFYYLFWFAQRYSIRPLLSFLLIFKCPPLDTAECVVLDFSSSSCSCDSSYVSLCVHFFIFMDLK